MKKSREKEVSKIPVLEIFPPIPAFFQLFNTAEILTMKLALSLYSDPDNKFKKDFNGLKGQWVHTSMANSIGLTETQFIRAINTLSEPKGKNKTVVFISKRVLHTGKNGSDRYLIPNPIVLDNLIYWSCLNDFWKERFKNLIKMSCNKLSIDKAGKLFEKEYKSNKEYYSRINSKREVTNAEKEIRNKMKNRSMVNITTTENNTIKEKKVMRKPTTVSRGPQCTEKEIDDLQDVSDEDKKLFKEQLKIELKMYGFVPKGRFDPVDDEENNTIYPEIINPMFDTDIRTEDTCI